MQEAIKPQETLFVVDAMTGQDAVNTPRASTSALNIDGVVLTKLDGDARGGAALSIRSVVDKPIKFIGTGEKMEALDEFHPDRMAGRILGMGDVVSLVEKAQETLGGRGRRADDEALPEGSVQLERPEGQLQQMLKMGDMSDLMGMMPGMGKMQKQMDEAGFDDRALRRQIALIDSMTKAERRNPAMLQASRRKRIAAGAGLDVSELNRLLKMHRQMADVMKKMGGMGKKGLMRGGLASMFGMGGGMPAGMPGGPAGGGALPQGLALPPGLGGLGRKK